jgi:hypothetical protein
MLISCDNPFFPDTGLPLKVSNPRLTPSGVISQLFQSYETRRIELFTDVLSKEFRFYIASGIDRKKMIYSDTLLSEKPDTFMLFVDKNKIYYSWGYGVEVSSTKKLFTTAEMIEIPSRPAISDIKYIVNSSGDTVFAEVKVTDVTFKVSQYENINSLVTYSLENQPQVFLMERDQNKLWVIKKWFDLGSE